MSELTRISLSTPGEQTLIEFDGFTIYSVRVSVSNVNVIIQNISIYIPNDIDDNNNDEAVHINCWNKCNII